MLAVIHAARAGEHPVWTAERSTPHWSLRSAERVDNRSKSRICSRSDKTTRVDAVVSSREQPDGAIGADWGQVATSSPLTLHRWGLPNLSHPQSGSAPPRLHSCQFHHRSRPDFFPYPRCPLSLHCSRASTRNAPILADATVSSGRSRRPGAKPRLPPRCYSQTRNPSCPTCLFDHRMHPHVRPHDLEAKDWCCTLVATPLTRAGAAK